MANMARIVRVGGRSGKAVPGQDDAGAARPAKARASGGVIESARTMFDGENRIAQIWHGGHQDFAAAGGGSENNGIFADGVVTETNHCGAAVHRAARRIARLQPVPHRGGAASVALSRMEDLQAHASSPGAAEPEHRAGRVSLG